MENNIKVSRAHRALAIFYGVLATFWLIFTVFAIASDRKDSNSWGMLILPIVCAGMAALHVYVARGAYIKNNTTRIVSMAIGGLMILGFPIGTIIGIYLLTNSQSWSTNPLIPSDPSPIDSSVWPPPPTSPTA